MESLEEQLNKDKKQGSAEHVPDPDPMVRALMETGLSSEEARRAVREEDKRLEREDREMVDELMVAGMTKEEAEKEAAKRLKAKGEARKDGLQLDEPAYKRENLRKQGMREEADKNL